MNVVYTKFREFHNKEWNSEVAENLGEDLLVQIFGHLFSRATRIVVKGESTDDRGVVKDFTEYFVYKSYTDALDKINKLEYSKNVAVEVFEISVVGYSHMFYKTFDGTNYSRLAQPHFIRYDLSTVRDLYDSDAMFYIMDEEDR